MTSIQSLLPYLPIGFGIMATIGTIVALIVIVREGKLRKPKMHYTLGGVADLADLSRSIPEKFRTQKKINRKEISAERIFYFQFLDKDIYEKFLIPFTIVGFPILIKNSGTKTANNIQVHVEFPADNHVSEEDEKLLRAANNILKFSDDLKSSETIYGNADFSAINIPDGPKQSSYVVGNLAYSFTNIPKLRPGEGIVIAIPMKLRHLGPGNLQVDSENMMIPEQFIERVEKISGVRDFFPIITFFRSDEHNTIKKSMIFMSTQFAISGEGGIELVNKFTKEMWLGSDPGEFLVWRPLGLSLILFWLGLIHTKGKMFHNHPAVFHSGKLIIARKKEKELAAIVQEPPGLIGHGSLFLPNIDFFNVPKHINQTSSLLSWMGFFPVKIFGRYVKIVRKQKLSTKKPK